MPSKRSLASCERVDHIQALGRPVAAQDASCAMDCLTFLRLHEVIRRRRIKRYMWRSSGLRSCGRLTCRDGGQDRFVGAGGAAPFKLDGAAVGGLLEHHDGILSATLGLLAQLPQCLGPIGERVDRP